MNIISFRGLTDGPDIEKENTEQAINHASENYFLVMVDVRFHNNEVYVGHDTPLYPLNGMIHDPNLIFICHDRQSLHFCAQRDAHHIYKSSDDYIYSNKGWVFANQYMQSAGRECISMFADEGFLTAGEMENQRFSGIVTMNPVQFKQDWLDSLE